MYNVLCHVYTILEGTQLDVRWSVSFFLVHAVSRDDWSSEETDVWCLALGAQRSKRVPEERKYLDAWLLLCMSWFDKEYGVFPQMLSCLEYMYHDLGLVKEFNMNPITLKRWLVRKIRDFPAVLKRKWTTAWKNGFVYISQLAIQENYRSNPFHNFRHCFCVSQMMYGVIHLANLQVRRFKLFCNYTSVVPTHIQIQEWWKHILVY